MGIVTLENCSLLTIKVKFMHTPYLCKSTPRFKLNRNIYLCQNMCTRLFIAGLSLMAKN